MERGFFITLEGGEGSGKSTQARLLAAALKARPSAKRQDGRRAQRAPNNRTVVHTREPGGTRIAEAVRRVLLDPSGRVAPVTELLLYEAARAQHVEEVVRPALARGAVVVCERYTDSTLAYQGYGRGLDIPSIKILNRVATGGLAPDFTILLDVPVARGLPAARRLSKRLSRRGRVALGGDRLEREPQAFHEKVRRGYLRLAKAEPGRFFVTTLKSSPAETQAAIWRETERRLARRYR